MIQGYHILFRKSESETRNVSRSSIAFWVERSDMLCLQCIIQSSILAFQIVRVATAGDGKEEVSTSKMTDLSCSKSTIPKGVAFTDRVFESQTEATSTRQQLFSFPKPPAQRTPSSPLFHLCIDTDSRKGSSRFGTPPSTADSTPSFATFLQHRPSTSISGGEGTVASSKTVMAVPTRPLTQIPRSSTAGLFDKKPERLRTSQTLDNLNLHSNPPSPLQSSEETSQQSPGIQRIPIPKALSPRAAPLFVFLRNDTLPRRIAVEGVVEWTEHWVKRGIRVRVLCGRLRCREGRGGLLHRIASVEQILMSVESSLSTSNV